MGAVTSCEPDCACACEDSGAGRYADSNAGGKPPEYPWSEEVCRFQEASNGTQNAKDVMFSSPGLPSSPAHRGSRNPEDYSPATPATPAPARQSWQDLDADGNYHLTFNLRPGDRIGLQLVETRDPRPGLLTVSSVESTGPFAYTSRESPGLFSGDVIMKVNKRRGAATSLRDLLNQAASSGGELLLMVQARPAAFDVSLKREGPNCKKLGLSIQIDREDQIPRMRVRTVRTEGLIPKWNEMNGATRICQGDWITQVNGVGKSADLMFKMMQVSNEGEALELQIETPSRDLPRQDLEPIASPMASPMPSPRQRESPMPSPRGVIHSQNAAFASSAQAFHVHGD